MSESKGEPGKQLWRTAKDPKTGREYYYNSVTKETTWTKPDSLLTDTELSEARKKKDDTKRFFNEMEKNMLRKIEGDGDYVQFSGSPSEESKDITTRGRRDSDDGFLNGRPRRSSVGGIRLVRTISTIDDELLEMMKHGASSSYEDDSSRFMPDPFGGVGLRQRTSSLSRQSSGHEDKEDKGDKADRCLSPDECKAIHAKDKPKSKKKPKQHIRRRNSTGTIYVDATISKQDDAHTMDCIGVVIRAHMLDAAKQTVLPRKEYEAFDDINSEAEAKHSRGADEKEETPTLETITDFFKMVFEKCQIEHECIIITLIYIERLVKATKGRLVIRSGNWRSILFACMVMASKVWDDLSMWNVDFSQVSTEFDLQRINELELALLAALEYSVKVPASEYAKYYFHLRSMMARLGFHNKSISMLMPLDVNGAKKLELSTEQYEYTSVLEQSTRRRGVSVIGPGTINSRGGMLARMHSSPEGADPSIAHEPSMALEQLVHGVHLCADGSVPTPKKSGTSAKAEAKK